MGGIHKVMNISLPQRIIQHWTSTFSMSGGLGKHRNGPVRGLKGPIFSKC